MSGDVEMTEADRSAEPIDIDLYRRFVQKFSELRRYNTALFWAEKVCALSKNDPKDIYTMAQVMFLLKEFHRAVHTVRLHQLEKSSMQCYNLLLESLYEIENYKEAELVIKAVDIKWLMSQPLLGHQPEADGGGVASMDAQSSLDDEETIKTELLASTCVIKGKIFQALENHSLAMDYYLQALHKSVFCYEALVALVQNEMLMAWEENDLMNQLPFSQQTTEADAKLVKKLYETQLKKYYESLSPPLDSDGSGDIIHMNESVKELMETINQHRKFLVKLPKDVLSKFFTPTPSATESQSTLPANMVLKDLKVTPFSLNKSQSPVLVGINDNRRSHMGTGPYKHTRSAANNRNILTLETSLDRLQLSTDIMAAKAEQLFYECSYQKTNRIVNELLKIDPYHTKALTVQISCLTEFKDYQKLFSVAHKMVEIYPDRAISWYAVGCYYDLIVRSDLARRYFQKATTLDKLFGPAWLSIGHSFANENEHDQAMNAYLRASQLMRGCHLPLLYVGIECRLNKNLELADRFFFTALTVAPLDVYIMHELAVLKHEHEYFKEAEAVFRATADAVVKRAKDNNEEISSHWEPLFNNLGHCCRKNKKFTDALKFHEQAQLLRPQNPQNLTAIGFIHALVGDLDTAITYFHKSLAMNRTCMVTATILKMCIKDLIDGECLVDDICGPTKSLVTQRLHQSLLLNTTKEMPALSLKAQTEMLNAMLLKLDVNDNTPDSSLDMIQN